MAVLGLTIAACGSDDDSGSDTTEASADTSGETTTDTAAPVDTEASATPADTTADTEAEVDSETTVAAPSGEPVVIGLQYDDSGPGAAYSTLAANSVRDCVALVESEGGIGGRPIKIVEATDASNPTNAPAATRQLIEQGADVLILVSGSGAAAQSKPIASEEQIPAIAAFTTNDTIGQPPDNEFVFTLANPIRDWVTVYLAAFERAGIKKLGYISDDSPAVSGLNDLMIPLLEAGGIEIVQEQYAVDATDITAEVTRIADADVDGLFIQAVGGPAEALAHNTAYTVMPDTPRFAGGGLGNQPANWALANPGALDGYVYVSVTTPDNPRTQELTEYLSETRGEDVIVTNNEAQPCDAVELFRDAIEAAGPDADGPAINAALQSITGYTPYFGAEGFTLSFSADKHNGADSTCGIILREFDGDVPGEPWEFYEPDC